MHWAGLRPVYVMRRRVIISPTPSLSSRCTQCSPQSFPSHWLQFSLLSLSLRKKSNNRFSFFFLSLPLVLALGGHHGQLQLTWSDRRTVVSVVLISLAIITSPSSFLRSHALASLHAPLLSTTVTRFPLTLPRRGGRIRLAKRAQRRLNLGLITRLQRSTAIQRSSDHRPDAYSINGGTVVECTLIGGEIANRSKMRVGWFEG